MNAEQLKRAGRHWSVALADHLRLVASLITATGIIAGALWMLFGNQIEPYLMLPTSVETLQEQSSQSINNIRDDVQDLGNKVDAGFADQTTRIEKIEKRVDVALRPDIVEWDTFRSGVTTKTCVRGKKCSAAIWQRRTEAGKSCDPPTFERYIRDSEGNVIVAGSPDQLDYIVNSSTEWVVSEVNFTIPRIASWGPALFFMELDYQNCSFAENEVIEVTSPPLAFSVVSGE